MPGPVEQPELTRQSKMPLRRQSVTKGELEERCRKPPQAPRLLLYSVSNAPASSRHWKTLTQSPAEKGILGNSGLDGKTVGPRWQQTVPHAVPGVALINESQGYIHTPSHEMCCESLIHPGGCGKASPGNSPLSPGPMGGERTSTDPKHSITFLSHTHAPPQVQGKVCPSLPNSPRKGLLPCGQRVNPELKNL